MSESLSVLGIDAAWTEANPSGVSLIQSFGEQWKCVAIAPSYESYVEIANGHAVDWGTKPTGTRPNFKEILAATEILLSGKEVDLIAVDMPLSKVAIIGRRTADQAVSKQFGKYGCAVHSPNPLRPGKLSAYFTESLAEANYDLATGAIESEHHALIEVYPHPAIMRLLRTNYRVPYKKGARDVRLLNLERIVVGLRTKISDIDPALISKYSANQRIGLKRFEDAIDAIVCAWVGAEYLAENIDFFGDATAAIWIPRGN